MAKHSKHRSAHKTTPAKPAEPLVPQWLAITIGALAILLGLWLTAKPFESLQALRLYASAGLVMVGIGQATSGRPKEMPWLSIVVGAVVVLMGVAVLLVPGLTVRWTAVLVGVGLFTYGLIAIVEAFSAPNERFLHLAIGIGMVIIGLLSVASPDATVKTVALLVGPATIVFGVRQIFLALSKEQAPASGPSPRLSPHGR